MSRISPSWPTRIFWLSLGVCSLAFVLVLFQLSVQARLMTDDYCHVAAARELGPLGALAHWRNIWSGRWVSLALTQMVVINALEQGRFAFYLWTMWGACWGALWFWLHRVNRVGALGLPSRSLPLLALAGLALLYGVQPNRSTVWFWLSGSAVHLWPVPLALVGAALLWQRRPRTGESIGAAICAVLLSGMSESSALAVVLLWCGALVWSARHQRESLRARAWPLFVYVLALAFALSAPGNGARAVAESATVVEPVRLMRAFAHTYRVLIENGLSFLIAALATGLALGLQRARKTSDATRFSWRWPLALVAVSFIAQAPGIWAFQGLAPPRSWVPTEVLLLGATSLSGYGLARHLRDRTALALALCALAWLAVLPFFWHLQTRKLPQARKAARAFDVNYRLFHEQKRLNRRETLVVPLLPPTDAVSMGEPMPTTKHWISGCLRDGLELPFEVRRDR